MQITTEQAKVLFELGVTVLHRMNNKNNPPDEGWASMCALKKEFLDPWQTVIDEYYVEEE